MKLSILIPAYNEEMSIAETVELIHKSIDAQNIDFEIIVVNDNSNDNTEQVLKSLCKKYFSVNYVNNQGPNGFGYAIKYGFDRVSGDCVAIMMADLSDSPDDLIKFYKTMIDKNVDCVFGTRWGTGGKVNNYPIVKKIINRIANNIIRIVMNIKYNDTTNAFKLYKKEVIDGVKPILSPHFNITIELPLKAIIRGYSYTVVPNSWTVRKFGASKLKIKEMGSRYFFILCYCFIEKLFSKKDYKKK